MSISLEKRAQSVGIILEKHNILKAPTVRAGLALDISGSARGLYKSGVIQETTDRLLAVAMQFDDNGEMDMWTFTNAFDRLEVATAADYGGYVEKHILNNSDVYKWGATSYGPIMQDIVEFYFEPSPVAAAVESAKGFLGGLFGKKAAPAPVVAPVLSSSASIPAMVMFVTDGSCDDERAAERVLREAQKYPIYWQMVGVGDAHHFRFLEKMADDLPNVGFVNMASLDVTDEQLYEQLVAEEFCAWVKKI